MYSCSWYILVVLRQYTFIAIHNIKSHSRPVRFCLPLKKKVANLRPRNCHGVFVCPTSTRISQKQQIRNSLKHNVSHIWNERLHKRNYTASQQAWIRNMYFIASINKREKKTSNYHNNKTVYVRHIIFNEWEATCFGPYKTITRPSYESSH
jgi:hypothetical protein